MDFKAHQVEGKELIDKIYLTALALGLESCGLGAADSMDVNGAEILFRYKHNFSPMAFICKLKKAGHSQRWRPKKNIIVSLYVFNNFIKIVMFHKHVHNA